MSRWFRHYAGMMRDEKLVRVAVKASQPIERVIWVWGAILESASEVNDGGRYDFDAGEAAYFLRCDDSDVGAILTGLEGNGRILQGVVAKWGDRQFDSDKSKERQRKYRERRNSNPAIRPDDSDNPCSDVPKPSRDGELTPQEYRDREQNTSTNVDGAKDAPDTRTTLFQNGLSELASMTGKPPTKLRPLVGRWLRDADDDALRILSLISKAKQDRPADPIPWIEAHLRQRKTGPPLRSMSARLAALCDQPIEQTLDDYATNTEHRLLASNGR